MKKIIRIGLVLGAIVIMVCNVALDVKMDKNGSANLALVENLSFADSESGGGICSLNVGDNIYGTSCYVISVTGFAAWYFTFDTSTCDSWCSGGGSNCCYGLV